MEKLIELIDFELKKVLEDGGGYQKKIFDAMDYSLFTGGKRLRPIMAIASYKMFGSNIEEIIPYAIAIEMIHTYSLIHDDLPSMDNDDYRRGKLTNHKMFGENMAILAGDGLLNLAFETMANYMEKLESNDCKKHIRAFSEIGKYSGVRGMIGGQVVDITSGDDSMTEDKLLFMYRTKTAALIQSALVAGAIIGGAKEDEVQIIREFGLNMGLAYQIRDDILDAKQDISIEKLTYLTFNDLDKAKMAVEEYSHKAVQCLNMLEDRNCDFFIKLTEELINRSS